jgi:Zn-finger nucleic acid-binding protein
MQCPFCPGQLERARYEGLPVFQCSICQGYLIESRRVTDIKRRGFKSKAELTNDSAAAVADNLESLRCPRCRRKMAKERAEPPSSFQIDTCQDCSLVWLDLGELAQLQLDYEATPRGTDARRMRKRQQEMTAAEQAEFVSNLAKLPEGDATLLSAFGRGLAASWDQCWRRQFYD